jgi:hypothetical protein
VARSVPELFFEPSNFEHRAILRKAHSVHRVRVMAGSCGGQTRHQMIAASPPSTHFPGAISCSTTRLSTQTNLPNRRCPIQEQRLTRSAPRRHRCLSLHTSLTPRSQRGLSLHISLMPRNQRCLSLRMSLTRACSRWAKVGRGVPRGIEQAGCEDSSACFEK